MGRRKSQHIGGIMELTQEEKDKWNRGVDLFTESVWKPDEKLRQCARNQDCYQELMDVREDVLQYLKKLRWK